MVINNHIMFYIKNWNVYQFFHIDISAESRDIYLYLFFQKQYNLNLLNSCN
jgi:hypothetical protein